MKRKIAVIICSLIIFSFFAQEKIAENEGYETVKKLQTERDIAQRAENLLFPFVGKTIVVVDLDLRYPSDMLRPFGMTLDKGESLPGLPVARSKGILPTTIDDQETYPTFIVSKKVTVYINKKVSGDIVDFVTQNLFNWLKIDEEKGDELIVHKNLDFKEEELGSKKRISVSTIQIILAGIFLIILIVFIILFSRSNRNLSESMKEINISGFDKALRLKGEQLSAGRAVAQSSLPDSERKKPLPIRIIESDQKEDHTLDFDFLEEQEPEAFMQLMTDEAMKDIAFLLTKMSHSYVAEVLRNFQGDVENLLAELIAGRSRSKKEAEALKNRLLEKQKNYQEEANLKFEGKATLSQIINNLPDRDSQKVFKKIKDMNPELSAEIRKTVFLLEDILQISNEIMEEIIISIGHDLLVRFIASVQDQQIKQKFFNNITIRATTILHEDLDVLGELSQTEKEKAINEMLFEIRTLLSYK